MPMRNANKAIQIFNYKIVSPTTKEKAGFYSIQNTHTQNATKILPIFGFRGGPWTIPYHLVKIAVPPVTAYMELKEISPLLF